MNPLSRLSLFALISFSLLLTSAIFVAPTVAEIKSAKIGSGVADFELKTHRGTEVSLSAVDEPLVVLAFLGTECPLVKLYGPRLNELQREFSDKGVAFFGINANKQDSVTDIDGYVAQHDIQVSHIERCR